MALTSTMHRFQVDLADVGRAVYEHLDLRVAMHPSESTRYMLSRVLAYCLRYEPGIELGRGVSTAEEPAVWVKDLRGDVTAWIEVGQPSPERLHKAAKTGARVYLYAHKDPEPLLRELRKKPIHRQQELEVWVLPSDLLEAFAPLVTRQERWSLTVSDGQLYLSCAQGTFEGSLQRRSLD